MKYHYHNSKGTESLLCNKIHMMWRNIIFALP